VIVAVFAANTFPIFSPAINITQLFVMSETREKTSPEKRGVRKPNRAAGSKVSQKDKRISMAKICEAVSTIESIYDQLSSLKSQISTFGSQQLPPPSSALPLAQDHILSELSSGPLPIYEVHKIASEESDGFFAGLIDRARANWLLGNWTELAKIDLAQIEHHPDRARLALFGAVGNMEVGQHEKGKKLLCAAKMYGCPEKLIMRVLLFGIHSNLAAANFLAGRELLAKKHENQLEQLGLPLPDSKRTPRVQETPIGLVSQSPSSINKPALQVRVFLPDTPPPSVRQAYEKVFNSSDITGEVARLLRSGSFSQREKFLFLGLLASRFQQEGNKMQAGSLLEESSYLINDLEENYKWSLVKSLISLGQAGRAVELLLRHLGKHPFLNAEEAETLEEACRKIQEGILDQEGHGHEVLMAFMKKKAGHLRTRAGERKPVLIEIGTTRESASGQGSTRRLAEFCRQERFHFITVDMDSANTEMAAQMFKENGFSFEAVHSKGEDFLADYSGPMDCVFLDAYDFDHGKHSELRQSRYEKFLGSRIDEQQCHKMHYDCAKLAAEKIADWGVICLDDTWLDQGRWTAKGTLAVPFLLSQNYNFLDIRNRSALLGTPYWFEKVS
jgi:hypothetical protein